MTEKNKIIYIQNLNTNIDNLYSELLDKKEQFLFVSCKGIKYVLTKEKSIISINDTKTFLNSIKSDIYYKSIVKKYEINIDKKDLELYKQYIEKFKIKLTKKKYNDKYYFGCVAIKTSNGFITTIRGKEDLNEFTLVENVDHDNHIINVLNKKATLNAPLLDYIFKNRKVKAIVHLHEFDNELPFYDYAFPGTLKDSVRDNTTSFNIMYHGVIYLFDKNENIL